MEEQGRDRLSALSDLASAALARDPARQAIEFEGRWHTWGDLRRTADAIEGALADGGAGPAGAVLFVARNHPATIAALLALIAQGRTVRMIYPFQSPEGIARDVAALDGAALIAAEEDLFEEVRAAAAAKGVASIALDGMDARLTASATAAVPPAGSEPLIEILTSGTTGAPKRFAVPYVLLEKHFVTPTYGAAADTDPVQAPPFLLYFPLGNITGLYITLPTLLAGQRIVLLDRFRLDAWHAFVRTWRPAQSGLPPSCLQQVLDRRIPREDLASLKVMGVGAAPLDPAVQARFEETYGIPVLVSYGATEFAGPVTAMSQEDHARFGRVKLGTVGKAMPGVKLRVVEPETGAELPMGTTGLLEVVSPRIGPEWIRTTDLAELDADGFLYIRGRADGAINRGGFKIVPEAIETALMQHPSVSEAAVVGIPDGRLGEVPAAAVRLRPATGATPSELEGHLRKLVLAPQVPARWLFCEDFPRTPSHKIDRQALKAVLADSGDSKN